MSTVTFDFTGRAVIVTGAAQGVGLAIAELFSRSGADVCLVDMDEELLRAVATRLGAVAVGADVSITADVERVVATAVDRFGRVDVLVNNAGILRDRRLWKLDDEDWDHVLAVHLGGSFRLIRACTPHFRAQRAGRVINVTSYSGLHGNVGQANYAAAKAGVIGLTKTAAKELAAFGVTVNAISPNAATRMVESIPEARRDEIAAGIPLGRFGEPSEMAAAVAFLASDEAAYVTGVVLPVDGGLSM
jgi:3-oxoacyl-[acyl-carrier protein] reductase